LLPLLLRRSPAPPVLRPQPEAVVVEAVSAVVAGAEAGADIPVAEAAEREVGAMPVAALAVTSAAVEAGISVAAAATSAAVQVTSVAVMGVSGRVALHRQ
jgi:hypothetical protein